MDIRLTAQLIVSDRKATLAFSIPNQAPGPNGELSVAILLGTSDGGKTWNGISLVRTFWNRLRYWGYPTWPPEAVIELADGQFGAEMTFRDEWVPYESGGESLWKAVQNRDGKWSVSRIRFMDYEDRDSPHHIPEIVPSLPPTMLKPPASLMADLAYQEVPAEISMAFTNQNNTEQGRTADR